MYGLIGEKLEHSHSKIIHEKFGLYSYELFPLQKHELENFLKRKDWQGINVTIPYKKDVIPFCDSLSQTAQKIGSVNTIVRKTDGSLYGDNTDYFGFLYMASKAKITFSNKKVLVLGSGGTSLMALAAITDQGGNPIVVSRNGKNNYTNLALHNDAEIIVNTTPVGMFPNTDISPLNLSLFKDCKAVLDVVYNPIYTRLLMQAIQLGIPCSGGLNMLVAQAKRAAELFTRQEIEDSIIGKIADDIQREYLNIVLIGMPGSGKSTIGKSLSKKLGISFKDTDIEIEKNFGKCIPDIFKKVGEIEFRRLEAIQAQCLGRGNSQVIATGGGIIKDPLNYFRLKQNGITIFLERNIDYLATKGRPLSKSRVELEKLYSERIDLYKSFADYTIDSNVSIGNVVKAIREIIKR